MKGTKIGELVSLNLWMTPYSQREQTGSLQICYFEKSCVEQREVDWNLSENEAELEIEISLRDAVTAVRY